MIRRLQQKFVWIVVTAIALVIVILLGSINLLKHHITTKKADEMVDLLTDNGGQLPGTAMEPKPDKPKKPDRPEIDADTGFKTRFFVVWLDHAGQAVQVDTGHIAAVTSEEAIDYGVRAAGTGRERGYDDNYRYLVSESQKGYMVLFLDCGTELSSDRIFLMLSCAIGGGTFILISLIAVFCSRLAIRPICRAMEKQRQFIADASHELKTPLAIISANNDVMELTHGQAQWTTSIRNQVDRMDKLLKYMLELTKLEAEQPVLHMELLELGELVQEAAEPFVLLASSNDVTVELHIEPQSYTGDKSALQQLVCILMDNAVKYAGAGGRVWVALERNRLTVDNTCPEMPQGDLNRLFDRFYRADTSRSRQTGGYGIGLSIAQSICHVHHIKLAAERISESIIRFSVQF